MEVIESATMRRRVHANATVRVCSAREALWRAQSRQNAPGSPAEALRLRRRVAEASAELAAREEWLHWIEHGTTMRPERDGEWGPAAPTEDRSRR